MGWLLLVRCFGSELVAASPPFLCFGGASERVVWEQLLKCYGLGAGGSPCNPYPPLGRVVSNVDGLSSVPRVFVWGWVFGALWCLCVGSELSLAYGA